jgi:hypothetical protein
MVPIVSLPSEILAEIVSYRYGESVFSFSGVCYWELWRAQGYGTILSFIRDMDITFNSWKNDSFEPAGLRLSSKTPSCTDLSLASSVYSFRRTTFPS